MNRRNFISASLALSGALATRRLFAQPAPGTRAAIVIGVDKTGNLPVLKAAKSGASEIATWLTGEGFEVFLFVDANKPVFAGEIFQTINTLVKRGTLEQLVVYFAGHGFIKAASEFWLLSDAPQNPNEAINLNESAALAERVGIPNITFISDACRSTADSLQAQFVQGSLIFPNQPKNTPADIDRFFATLVGDPAYEVPVTQSSQAFQGIYTSAFLDAYAHPDREMVKPVDGRQVVPNRQLRDFLEREVPKRAQAKSIKINQKPHSVICSRDSFYLGEVRAGAPLPAAPVTAPTATDVTAFMLRGVFSPSSTPRFSEAMLKTADEKLGVLKRQSEILRLHLKPDQAFLGYTGVVVTGARVAEVVTDLRLTARLANSESQNSAMIRVETRDERGGSIALQFADGSGTLLAALRGYVATVSVDPSGVRSVSYLPTDDVGEEQTRKVAESHAAIATATQLGLFRIEGPRESRQSTAARLADQIRLLKSVDPTLGVYAAYAYADAGLPDQISSVRRFMRDSLGIDLFDVALLAGALWNRDVQREPVAPYFPMLAQGWSLLRAYNTEVPREIAPAANHLRSAIWNSFTREGMEIIKRALPKLPLRQA